MFLARKFRLKNIEHDTRLMYQHFHKNLSNLSYLNNKIEVLFDIIRAIKLIYDSITHLDERYFGNIKIFLKTVLKYL